MQARELRAPNDAIPFGKMAQATKLTEFEIERRRAAASRLRGLFADVAPNESLVDELIADRRTEAQAETREGKADRRARS